MKPPYCRLRPSLLFLLLFFSISKASGYTDLSDAFSALGFNPNTPGNEVVVLLSDPHMNLDLNVLPLTTNLDSRLVRIVNEMKPAPAKVLILGDVSTTLSPIPGWVPRAWSMQYGTNEMSHWASAILALTNVSQTNILWVPGNHDQLATETNAETFRLMFPFMPTFQHFDLGGTRFMLLNSGNYGRMDEMQVQWLRRIIESTPDDIPLALFTHVPPFMPPMNVYYRGVGPVLREVLGLRSANSRIFSGHFHARSATVYTIGRGRVASQVIGTANQKNTNGASYDSGFMFLCLSNGIAGVVYYHYNNGDFEVLPEPEWDKPSDYVAAFETAQGLLWRRLKSASRAPEVLSVTNDDAVEWFAYTTHLEMSMPLNLHSNTASEFLLLGILDSSTRFEFSLDRFTWLPVAKPASHSNYVYRIPIPDHIQSASTGYARISATGVGNMIGGWGLATTNAALITYPQLLRPTDKLIYPGEVVLVTNDVLNPYSPPDKMHFALLSAPQGATIGRESGIFFWACPESRSAEEVRVVLKVADDGSPNFASTQTFSLIVSEKPRFVSACQDATNLIMRLQGPDNVTLELQRSTNMALWEKWFTTNSHGEEFEIRDAFQHDRAFYRAIIHR